MTNLEIDQAIGETIGEKPRKVYVASADGGKTLMLSNERAFVVSQWIEEMKRKFPGQYDNLKCEETLEYSNYHSDLNAMHIAEKSLPDKDIIYVCTLYKVVCPNQLQPHCVPMIMLDWLCIHATAQQKAEAFLRTVGKWKA